MCNRKGLLNTPHNGNREVEILEKYGCSFLVRICKTGEIIRVNDDEIDGTYFTETEKREILDATKDLTPMMQFTYKNVDYILLYTAFSIRIIREASGRRAQIRIQLKA